ncbi:MAG: preprotein translocase subunit YajC [Actinobacteria bacterium]|nr:preprotein translocase subunit YajC [Actinomycetota bacterium]
MGQLIVILAMLALLWLLLIRPARRRQAAQQELLSGIEVGDEILTAGGLYGHIREFQGDDELIVEVAPDVQLRVARRAVAAVIPPQDEMDDEDVLDGELIDDDSASGPDADGRDRG